MQKHILTFLIFSLYLLNIQGQTITLTTGDSKNAKVVKIMGVSFNNAYLKDNAGTYGLTGSLSILKDENKKITNKLLTLGNGGGQQGKQNSYAIALNLPVNNQKGGIYKLTNADDGEIVYNPKGKNLDLEYAVKSVTINIKTNDGENISGEISGVFQLIGKANKNVPNQINITRLNFSKIEIIEN